MSKTKAELELTKELLTLSKEIEKLKNLEFIQVLKHPLRLMWLSFLKGLMIGFGSVLGASVLVGLFVYLIAQISFVPIVGDFVEAIVSQIDITQNGTTQDNTNETKKNIELKYEAN